MDFSRFKKISSDAKTTTLQHPQGHVIKIAHGSLSKPMKEKLDALPKHMAAGGMTEDPQGEVPPSPAPQQAPVVVNVNGAAPPVAAAPMAQMPVAPIAGPAPAAVSAPIPLQEAPQPQMAPAMAQQAPMGGEVAQPQAYPDITGDIVKEKALMQGLGQEQAGIQQEASALGAQGKAEAQVARQAAVQQQTIMARHAEQMQQLDQEVQAARKDVEAGHVDPNHYFANMGTGQKIRSAIGLILGGIGGGLTHQENPALKFMQSQINNDIEAQKSELGKKENLLGTLMRQYGNLKDASDMARVLMTDSASMQLKAAAAQAQDPIVKARALQSAGKIDMELAPTLGTIAMRRAILGGSGPGGPSPDKVIKLLVPPGQENDYYKELEEAQGMVKFRDNALGAFDKIAQINTAGNKLMNPLQSRRQIDAIMKPLVAMLSKETAGRFSEADAGYLESLFPHAWENAETQAIARGQLEKAIAQKMNFPKLSSINIDPMKMARFGGGSSGEKKIQLGPPKVR